MDKIKRNGTHDVIQCPKCHKDVEINIANAIDELGEVFRCPHCKWPIRYTDR